ncbi:MAG: AraC family transcriptional regulator [Gemmatimonadales bacterium]|nr:AraC family transcriptional regulator [Gemmatimonadales bacterium]
MTPLGGPPRAPQETSIVTAEASVNTGRFLVFEDRPSDSPLVERIWRSHSERAGTFLSVASSHCEMVVTRHRGTTFLTLRGPETRAAPVDCPADGEWLGIRLSLGTFLPFHPAAALSDRRDVHLTGATGRSFRLHGLAWEYPDFENAETLVTRLFQAGVLARDPAVGAALSGEWHALSRRSIQRHFLRATGITHVAYRQIQRARYATTLLERGVSILDTVHQAGYFDQAHLTRSLRRLIGETPARLRERATQLSFLYKTGQVGESTLARLQQPSSP